MSEMRAITALNEAKKLVKFFEVFETLEDVLKAVVSAEQALPRLKKDKESLLKDLEGLRESKAKAFQDFKTFKSMKESEATEMIKTHAGKMKILGTELKVAKATLDSEIESRALVIAEQKKIHESAMRESGTEHRGLTAKLSSLRGELDKLKSRLAAA